MKFAFELRENKAGWYFQILKTTATRDVGIDALVLEIQNHQKYLNKSGRLEKERKAKLVRRINDLVGDRISLHLREKIIRKEELVRIIDKVYERKLNPYDIANKIAKSIIKPRKYR